MKTIIHDEAAWPGVIITVWQPQPGRAGWIADFSYDERGAMGYRMLTRELAISSAVGVYQSKFPDSIAKLTGDV